MSTQQIKIDDIIPDPKQPRKKVTEEDIRQLAASYNGTGPEQPITVRRVDNGKFMIVLGEIRWRAAQSLGITELHCVVKEGQDEKQIFLAQLKENLHCKNLHPVEIGRAYRRAMDEFGLTQRELAQLVGISQSRIHDYANLASNLHDLLTNQIGEGQLNLSATQAIEIARVKVKDKQYEVAEIVKEKEISDYHQLHTLIGRVNLGMELYGNVPMKRSNKKDQPHLSLESIADGVLHVGKQRPGQPTSRGKCSYYQEIIHRPTNLMVSLTHGWYLIFHRISAVRFRST